MNKSKLKGHIRGLVPHLISGGLTHLQDADDALLFLEVNDQAIINLKFLLYCFEWMSGLRINYHKSEVLVMGVDSLEQERIANMFNCKVGSLPMVYLGIPISDMHLGIKALSGVVAKTRKRLQPWKGKHMSSGG